MAEFHDYMTVSEARWNLRQALDEGVECPCCGQFAKRYRRSLPSAAARVMIAMYRIQRGMDAYIFIPDLLDKMTGTAHQGGYGTLGWAWGLIERQPGERDDGSDRVGWWRLTDLGRAFVQDQVSVPRYAVIFNGKCLTLDGPPWSIRDALGKRFNYRELMEGV